MDILAHGAFVEFARQQMRTGSGDLRPTSVRYKRNALKE